MGVNGDQLDNTALGSGAVYLFAGAPGSVAQTTYVKASNTGNDDWFGETVALDGDTLAVGASRESSATTGINRNGQDNSAIRSGAVYVFQRSGAVWAQQAYLRRYSSRRWARAAISTPRPSPERTCAAGSTPTSAAASTSAV